MGDDFIIHNLPLFMADSARTWLEHLLPNQIQSWADLKEIFVGNFRAHTHVLRTHGISKTADRSPGKLFVGTSGASLGSAKTTDADIIGAFLSGTTCESLVHKLGCKGP